MPLYEHVFLTRQDATNAQVDALTEQFKSVIATGGGTVGKTEYWGVKSLTFRIKKNRKAHYTMLNIDAPPAAIAEMERQMSINEDVIRFMTVRVEALEEGPSAMMRRRERRARWLRRPWRLWRRIWQRPRLWWRRSRAAFGRRLRSWPA
jgi:small subunit ribosomal protein S6